MAKLNFRQSLIKAGFIWRPMHSPDLPVCYRAYGVSRFVKEYITGAGRFKVLLIRKGEDLTQLPTTYLLEKPEQVQNKALPHILNSGYLCYANNDQTEWNPLDEASFAETVDRSIQRTLENAVSNSQDLDEYRHEFRNYWQGDTVVYNFATLSKETKNLKFCSYKVNINGNTLEHTEHIIYTQENEQKRWYEIRGIKTDTEIRGNKKDPDEGVCIVVNVKKNHWAPSGHWPPESFAEVLDWLVEADRSARDHLIRQLISKSRKRVLVVLQIQSEGQLGFKITLSSRFQQILKERHRRHTASFKSLLPAIQSRTAVQLFERLSIQNIDRNSVFLRNRPNPDVGDIRNLRIALIGCGTIGGYAAEYLIKAGAGAGQKGELTLYDADQLSTGNLGRHCLPLKFLGWNKAKGLAQVFKNEVLHPRQIQAKQDYFKVKPENMKQYDVIIDATGRVPVSLALASSVRSLPSSNRPIVIHGFNDRWGQDSVVFIDNGKACYGCLKKFKTNKVDKPAYDISRYSCGDNYTPYDAHVSIKSAALVLEAILCTLEKKIDWTYIKISNENNKSQKRQILKPMPHCEVCAQGVKN